MLASQEPQVFRLVDDFGPIGVTKIAMPTTLLMQMAQYSFEFRKLVMFIS
jgi:hypothetical protein